MLARVPCNPVGGARSQDDLSEGERSLADVWEAQLFQFPFTGVSDL